jgi:DNA adenine methylase
MKMLKWPSFNNYNTDTEDFEDGETFEKTIPIFKTDADEDEHIVAGIVYEPDTIDAQGDEASEEEIRKAAYRFMEDGVEFKVNHKGKPVEVTVLESYIAPQDLLIAKQKVKKGSWVLITRVVDDDIWQDIKDGKLTGYSMAGTATAA